LSFLSLYTSCPSSDFGNCMLGPFGKNRENINCKVFFSRVFSFPGKSGWRWLSSIKP
jgi:hypothetical protein